MQMPSWELNRSTELLIARWRMLCVAYAVSYTDKHNCSQSFSADGKALTIGAFHITYYTHCSFFSAVTPRYQLIWYNSLTVK